MLPEEVVHEYFATVVVPQCFVSLPCEMLLKMPPEEECPFWLGAAVHHIPAMHHKCRLIHTPADFIRIWPSRHPIHLLDYVPTQVLARESLLIAKMRITPYKKRHVFHLTSPFKIQPPSKLGLYGPRSSRSDHPATPACRGLLVTRAVRSRQLCIAAGDCPLQSDFTPGGSGIQAAKWCGPASGNVAR